MIKKALLAATVASGLIVPAQAGVYLPPKPKLEVSSPAIIKPESLEYSKHMLAMPFTLGMLAPKAVANFATMTHRLQYSSASNASSYTIGTAVDIGAAPTGGNRRYVIVAAACTSGSDNATVFGTSCIEIGGTGVVAEVFVARVNGSQGAGTVGAAIGMSEVNTGTTVRCHVVGGSSPVGCTASVWTIETGPAGIAHTALTEVVDVTAPAVTFTNSLSGDNFIGVSGWINAGSAHTWQVDAVTVGTEHNDMDQEGGEQASTWSYVLPADDASTAISISPSGTSVSLCVGRFRKA